MVEPLPDAVLENVQRCIRDLSVTGNHSQDHRNDSLSELRKLLVCNRNYRDSLCSFELGLLSALRDCLAYTSNPKEIDTILLILHHLSWTVVGKTAICSPQLHLIPVCLRLCRRSSATRSNLLSLFISCCLCEKRHSYLLSPEVDLLASWKEWISRDADDYRYYQLLANMAKIASDENIHIFLSNGVHNIVFNRLLSLQDIQFDSPFHPTGHQILNFIVSLSVHPAGAQAIYDLGQSALFYNVFSCNKQKFLGMQALFILANVYGTVCTPSDSNNCFEEQTAIGVIVSFFMVIVNFDENYLIYKRINGKLFRFGDLQLSTVVGTLKNLSMNDYYRRVMIEQFPDIIFLICKAMYDFNENKSQYSLDDQWGTTYAGGGGEDFRSVQFICELLLQFSFASDELKSSPSYQGLFDQVCVCSDTLRTFPELLEDLTSLPKERSVPEEIIRIAVLLLNRFHS
jgi:hypothetical protein